MKKNVKKRKLSTLLRGGLLFLFLWAFYQNSYAQYDNEHYIPPLLTLNGDNGVHRYQYLSITTLESTAFDVTITMSDGSIMPSGQISTTVSGNSYTNYNTTTGVATISNTQPLLIRIGNRQSNGISGTGTVNINEINTSDGSVSAGAQNRGLIVKSDNGERFFVNMRHETSSQAASLTSKGKTGLGQEFRVGIMPTEFNNTSNSNNNIGYITMVATENGTNITISDLDSGVSFIGHSGATITQTLSKGEVFAVAQRFKDLANPVADSKKYNGILVTSNKDIVVASGGGASVENSSGFDYGYDQLVPVEQAGDYFVLVKGQGANSTEDVYVVATEDNTVVERNGGGTQTINAGDYYHINGSGTQWGSNNMYITATKPVFVYQITNGDAAQNTGSMNLIPPANVCSNIDEISIVDPFQFGSTAFLNITVPKDNNTVITLYPNVDGTGTPLVQTIPTGSSNVGDNTWYTYRYSIPSGYDLAHVKGTGNPINVGFLATDSSNKGGAGYFAGFASPIFATIDPATITVAGGGAGAQYINEGAASPDNEFTLEFDIEISSTCSSAISLEWEIIAGSATIGGGGADVSVSGGATSGTITFNGGATGSTVQTISLPTITVNDDGDVEGLENILIRLSNPVNVSIAIPDTEIIIIDDETPAQAQCPGATVADLDDGGLADPRWFDVPTGGTQLTTGTALENLTLYYVQDGGSGPRTAHLVRLAATGELFFADIIKSPTDPSFSLTATSPFTDDISYSIIDPISGMEVTTLNGISLGGTNNATVTLGGTETSVLLRATQTVTDGGGGSCTPITAEALLIISADTDGDGVVNFYDIDDDNDGIVDFNELNCSVPPPAGITFNTSGTTTYNSPVTRAFTNFNGFLDSNNAAGIKANTNHELIAFEYNGTIYSTGVNNSRFVDDNNDFLPDGLDVGLIADGADIVPITATRWRAIAPVNEFTAGEAVEPSALDGDPTEANGAAIGPAIITAAAAPRNVLLTYGERGLSLSSGVFNPGTAGVLTYSLSSIDPNTIGDGTPDLLVNHLGLTNGSNRQIDVTSYDSSGNIIGNTARVTVGSNPLLEQNLDRYASNGSSDNIDREIRLEVIELSELGLTAANSANVQYIQVNLGSQSDIAFVAYNEQSINVCSDRHTDTDGIPDHLDLDSDNDGIPDNIEGQTTAGYIAPGVLGVAMQDSDGDGLSDTYDNDGANTYPTEGIEPVDTDGLIEDPTGEQTVPDFRDRDSDNDFFTDTYETSSVNFTALSYTNVNGGITDPSTFPDANSSTPEVNYREEADSDQDTILDKDDIDSDNDGILDTEDCLVGDDITGITGATTGVVRTAKGHTITIDGDNMTVGDGNFGSNPSPYDFKLAGSGSGTNTNTITFTFSEPISSFKLIVYDYDIVEFMDNFSVAPIQVDGDANFDGSQITNPQNDLSYTIVWAALPAGTTSISYDHTRSAGAAVFIQFEEICFDTDGDGVPNYIDLDSDNDGIYDIQEAGGTTIYDTNNDGLVDDITTDNAANDADNDGLSDLMETNIAADTGLTPINTDTNTNADYANTDSDGDLCFDTNEAYNTDNANYQASPTDTNDDGTYGGALTTADINANGTVSAASYTPVAGNLANVIDNTQNVCDVDTDGDGVYDKTDLDDDNDGILDTDEQNCNIPITGVTFQSPSSTVTAGDQITAIYTDFNGYNTGTGTRANDYNNLLAFEVGGQTYTTGVENSRIIDSNNDGVFEGVDTNGDGNVNTAAVNTRWRALQPGNDITAGVASEAALADGNASTATGMVTIQGFTASASRNELLTFGKRGLDLTTGIFNPGTGGNLLYKVAQVNPNSIGDGIPDILVNHIGNPGGSEGTKRVQIVLYDASGNVIGDRVKILFSGSAGSIVAEQRLDFYTNGGTGNRQDRPVRFQSIDLSEAGITTTDAANIAFIRVEMSNNTDLAFAAYNEESFVVCEDIDSDGDNIPDHLDLDSDNDGIYDVIEAGGTDVNNDGRADDDDDNADNTGSSGIPTSTSGGLVVVNTDGDEFGNHIDTDADGDGCLDANEAYNTSYANFVATPADTNGDGTYGGVITNAEVDANGKVTAASYTPLAANIANVISSVHYICAPDSDGDGINDIVDIDDDNDGVLDIDEIVFTGGYDASTLPAQTVVLTTDIGNETITLNATGIEIHEGSATTVAIRDGTTTDNAFQLTASENLETLKLTFNFFDSTESLDNFSITPSKVIGSNSTFDGNIVGSTAANQEIIVIWENLPTNTTTITWEHHRGNVAHGMNLAIAVDVDADNDGIVNRIDIDADNDGIYDIVETGNIALDTNNDGLVDDITTDNVANDADNDGLSDAIETANGADTGVTPVNTVSTTSVDFLNIDADGDECFDANEAYNTDYANYTASPTDTNGDGTYGGVVGTTVGTDITANGAIEGLTYGTNAGRLVNVISSASIPVCFLDTDNDGVYDNVDLDDDNDGILDTDEQNCNIPVTGVTFQSPPSTVTAGDQITAIYTDFNGYNTGTGTVVTDYHNLLAFELGATTYTTGVENSRLIDTNNDGVFEGIDTTGDGNSNTSVVNTRWRALRPGNNITEGSVSEPSMADGNSSSAVSTSLVPSFTSTSSRNQYLTHGKRGLDIITGVFNPGSDGNLIYKVVQVDPTSIGDGKPDILVNHIGGASSNEASRSVFITLYNASGNVLGNRVKIIFPVNNSADVGMQRIDVFTGAGAGSVFDRAIRFKSIDLSEVGITSGDAANIEFIRVQMSTSTDISFAAYNEESFVVCEDIDSDGDNIPDHLDLDSDNDGIYDVIEAGGTDANNDGRADDDDNNADNTSSLGVPTSAAGGVVAANTDGDEFPNHLDIDSDNDGCFDADEAYTADYASFLSTGTDTNADGTYGGVVTSANVDVNGVVTGLSHTTNTTSLANVTDATARVCDTDSDSDNIFDKEDLDSDNDAILDTVENTTPYTDADNDGIPIFLDDDDADATVRDADGVEAAYDADGDGIANHLDLDADGDGCADAIEGAGSYLSSNTVVSTMAGTVKDNLGTTVDTDSASPTYGVPIVAPAVTATVQAIGDSANNAVATACAFDLQLTKTVDKSVVRVNDTIVYSLTVTNHGANEASGITVTDTLPAGVSFVSAAAPPGTTFTSGTGEWSLGSEVLANGDSLTLTITVTVNGTGSITNQAEITTATGTDIDSTPGNGN